MSPPSRPVDPRSFPILGLLGAFACGPTSPQDPDSSTTGDPTTDPTTDPTAPTTGPIPECRIDEDCGYCGYCYEGICGQGSCCGAQGSQSARTHWRCSTTDPRPNYCYSDAECGEGYLCLEDQCTPVTCSSDADCGDGYVCTRNGCVPTPPTPPIPLPGCAPGMADITTWNLGNAPTAFLLADLDGDLDLDLAAGTPASGSIEIHLNDGAGKFVLAGAFGIGPNDAGDLALAAGDVDADGDLDLAVVTRQVAPTSLRLLVNDKAVFTVGEPRPIAPMPAQVFIADVDGDADLDLLALSESGQTVGVQLGDGKGGFSPELLDLLTGIAPRASVTDITLDGAADLLAPSIGGQFFSVWTGGKRPLLNPLTTFSAPEATKMTVLGGDLDLQGTPDLVILHPLDATGMVHVWSGIGPGVWSTGPQRFTTSRPLTGGLLAQLDSSPGLDLISATGQASITVLPGDGGGGFTCEHIFDLLGPSAPALLAVGDVDGDGFQDIVAGGTGMTDVVVIHPLL